MKNSLNILITAAAVLGMCTGGVLAEPSKNFKVFLCFGQSNMSGGAGVSPQAEDTKTNPRIFTLSFGSCQGWTLDKWGVAKEPLHCADNQNAMGPAFAFGRIMADSLDVDTIGLIPCGLYSRPIECFMKNGNNMGSGGPIPGIENGAKSAYSWMLNKCKIAQERGVFSGVILHQGESNSEQSDWADKVKTIYDDLKKDLALENDFPLVAGELLQETTNGTAPCCADHNKVIANIPKKLPFGYVASSKGLMGGGSLKQYHFDQAGYREMGKRMAIEMLKGLREVAKVAVNPRNRVITAASFTSTQNSTIVYSLNGKVVSSGVKQSAMKPGNLYVVFNKSTGASTKLMMAPVGR